VARGKLAGVKDGKVRAANHRAIFFEVPSKLIYYLICASNSRLCRGERYLRNATHSFSQGSDFSLARMLASLATLI
jgi:hypothetical protein